MFHTNWQMCVHTLWFHSNSHSKVLCINYHLHISFISEHTVLVQTPTEFLNNVLYLYLLILTTINDACTVQTANGFSVIF